MTELVYTLQPQPNPLPPTLPAGTRLHNGWQFVREATLGFDRRGHHFYSGDHVMKEGDQVRTGDAALCVCRPHDINWSTVPVREQRCAVCGGPGAATSADNLAYPLDGDSHLLCSGCWRSPYRGDIDADIRKRLKSVGIAEAPPQPAPVEARGCISCGAPGLGECAYCERRMSGKDQLVAPPHLASALNTERWLGPDPATRSNLAERKLIAAGHPSTWPSQEGEE